MSRFECGEKWSLRITVIHRTIPKRNLYIHTYIHIVSYLDLTWVLKTSIKGYKYSFMTNAMFTYSLRLWPGIVGVYVTTLGTLLSHHFPINFPRVVKVNPPPHTPLTSPQPNITTRFPTLDDFTLIVLG